MAVMLMLKLERLRKGWNQTALAFHTGVSVADLSRIETGRLRPYPRQLDRLGAALDVAPSMLLDEVEIAETEATKLVEARRARRADAGVARVNTSGADYGGHQLAVSSRRNGALGRLPDLRARRKGVLTQER